MISTKAHGMIDYLVGIALIAAPWIFGFADNSAAMWVPVILGASTLIYSLLTNYELGAVGAISMSTHLVLDVFAGIFLAISPWLFQFNDRVFLPHLIVGLGELLIVVMTRKEPAKYAVDNR